MEPVILTRRCGTIHKTPYQADPSLKAGAEFGTVLELESFDRYDDSGWQYFEKLVRVPDESDPVHRVLLKNVARKFEQLLREDGTLVAPHDGVYDTNVASGWIYLEDPAQTSMIEWSTLFPSAKALYPLQRVGDGGRVLPSGSIDERAKYLFTNMIDGIALRARARIMAGMVFRVASASHARDLRAVSLGCGAAVPDIDATLQVQRQLGKSITWELYDIDQEALQFAVELGEEAGLPADSLRIHPGSFVRAFALAPSSVDIVDVLGLWEYLPDATCAKLLARSYRLLMPGGSFICSNMRSEREQLHFNSRAVGWPALIHRTEAELAELAKAAGIASGLTSMTRSEDSVYSVMEIRKPLPVG